MLSRFGSDQQGVALDKLGGAGWQTRKAKMKQRIRDMAGELIEIAAARRIQDAEIGGAAEGESFDEFCARRLRSRRPRTSRAPSSTCWKTSPAWPRPMDRLICGDVGFGKTEVALRAAFVAAMSGAQVAVVVPDDAAVAAALSDILGAVLRVAGQGGATIAHGSGEGGQRGPRRPVRVTGEVNIVVGTHALLSKSIQFSDLGLLVVDEEQHFGVAHKERLGSSSKPMCMF